MLPVQDPYPKLNQYNTLTALTPYEDNVFMELPKGIANKSEDQMITLTLKSHDLVYNIKIFKKLLSFVTLSPDVKYQINLMKYSDTRKVINDGEYKLKETEHFCWDNLKSMDGKVLIYAGDEPKLGDLDNKKTRCLVPVEMSARE